MSHFVARLRRATPASTDQDRTPLTRIAWEAGSPYTTVPHSGSERSSCNLHQRHSKPWPSRYHFRTVLSLSSRSTDLDHRDRLRRSSTNWRHYWSSLLYTTLKLCSSEISTSTLKTRHYWKRASSRQFFGSLVWLSTWQSRPIGPGAGSTLSSPATTPLQST